MTGPDPSCDSAPLAALLARRRHLQAEAEAITAEIRGRGLARTANLVGELGERLALEVLGGTIGLLATWEGSRGRACVDGGSDDHDPGAGVASVRAHRAGRRRP